MSKAAHPLAKGAEILRMSPEAAFKAENPVGHGPFAGVSGVDSPIWEASGLGGNPHGVWALSGMPGFAWDKAAKIEKKKEPRRENPWSR